MSGTKKKRADCTSTAFEPVAFDRDVKSVIVVFRFESVNAAKTAHELADWLKEKRKIKVYSHPQQKLLGVKKITPAQLKDIDLVIVLGGDGTYLSAVRMLDGQKIPILGINMGSLGFLTENRKEDLYTAVKMTLDKKMEMRPRAMIEVQVLRKGEVISSAQALNDVVLERGIFSQLISFTILSEGHLVGHVKADGVVIATPTGSTAYNLAAGGPILHPHVRALVVTPICPHSLTHRPIIFSDDHTLTFRMSKKKKRAYLTIDGRNCGRLQAGDEVTVTRAECDHYVLRKPSQNYFELLREKLGFAER